MEGPDAKERCPRQILLPNTDKPINRVNCLTAKRHLLGGPFRVKAREKDGTVDVARSVVSATSQLQTIVPA